MTKSASRAVLTLSKAMFNAGCFSLPYAWKLGGLWVSPLLMIERSDVSDNIRKTSQLRVTLADVAADVDRDHDLQLVRQPHPRELHAAPLQEVGFFLG